MEALAAAVLASLMTSLVESIAWDPADREARRIFGRSPDTAST